MVGAGVPVTCGTAAFTTETLFAAAFLAAGFLADARFCGACFGAARFAALAVPFRAAGLPACFAAAVFVVGFGAGALAAALVFL